VVSILHFQKLCFHALDKFHMAYHTNFLDFDSQTPPAPRYDHAASIQGERYLLIFGGCSHSVFFNDLHLLDMQTVSK